MFIVFEDGRNGDLWIYESELYDEHKSKKYIEVDEKDIPKKNGYITKVKLVDNNIKWHFEKIKEPINSKKELDDLKNQNKILSEAITELANLVGGLI